MHHWSQLGTRNWRAKPGRTAGAIGAIALGVGVVIWVTCAYESVRLALSDQVWFWIGRSHLSVEANYGEQGTVFQKIADQAAAMANVRHVTYRLKHRMVVDRVRPGTAPQGDNILSKEGPAPPGGPAASRPWKELDAGVNVQVIGIRPELEDVFRQYDPDRVEGRMLRPEDTDAAVIDRALAAALGLGMDDEFRLRAVELDAAGQPTEKTCTLRVVGLLEHRRIAKQQDPVVLAMLEGMQNLVGFDREPRRVTKIDLILQDTSPAQLARTEVELHRLVGRYDQGFVVNSAANKLRQVEAAERQTQFLMLLVSAVALFTAFFIILSTLSMGMVERMGQLGTLRCLGMTRIQMASLVLGEAVALGLVGIILGIPVGLGLGRLTVYVAREYVGFFAVSRSGLALAVAGGAVTTLAGAILPMFQTMRVSPLVAARPQAQPAPGILAWIFCLLGAGMIAAHTWMLSHVPANELYLPSRALTAVALLYCGYALLVPAAIRVIGLLTVRVAAAAIRIRYRLLADQVGKAVWRSSAICCGLMVGLSLIVTLVVHGESIAAGWDFPKNFCEAFVFISPPAPQTAADNARRVGGVAESCLVNPNIRCTVYGKGLFNFPFSLFIAGDPDEFFRIANLEFVAGSKEDAIAKLRKGGCVLVTPEFVRAKKLDYGDHIGIKTAALFGTVHRFEIAGVVTSPALDIAANYFNAGGQLMAQSVLVVLGTFADARKVFGVPEEASLVLLNFDLPATAPPPEFDQPSAPDLSDAAKWAAMLERWQPGLPERKAELDQIAAEVRAASAAGPVHYIQTTMLRAFRESLLAAVGEWAGKTPDQRWQSFREELTMGLIARRSGANWEQHGSIRALKQRIDRDLRRATRLFAAIPIVALIVAALGVGNLMMANVASRSRQLATLRAVGATRWQIIRLVIGEALVLGTLGCAVGITLGLHAAYSIKLMIEMIWGYRPVWTIPYAWVGLGVGFTLLVCLLAGLAPAARAARSNIIEALQTT